MDSGFDPAKNLYRDLTGKDPEIIDPIPGSGSPRKYFRMGEEGRTVIGVYNEDRKENRAFLSFTRTFLNQRLPVPEVLAESSDGLCYLLHDLGDLTLYKFLQENRNPAGDNQSVTHDFPDAAKQWYKKVLDWLPHFQVSTQPDYNLCYPRPAFDRQSMHWDLNYFKYYYLKLAGISFDEQHLEDDFLVFITFLLQAPAGHFMYRDFQSRNIMLYEEQPWFIDYQGGRKGALQYDVASLLYDAKADIPEDVRKELLEYYFQSISGIHSFDREQFLRYYPGFVMIRIFQALGAYGFRGYYQKKSHFLQSIPYALKNLEMLPYTVISEKLPELTKIIESMIKTPVKISLKESTTDGGITGSPDPNVIYFQDITKPYSLKVLITSFSYMKGLPADLTGNGGGFIFDCRALPNPGRYDYYRLITGMDEPVIDFLKAEPQMNEFLTHVFALVDQSVKRYLDRKFSHLMVNFGCTGGQHRSVYCAEALARHLREQFTVNIVVKHREME
ncbi:MAG: phosphotransferase [Bacteroidales bacterium]|jgi:aminoglycoside/choline kinase family phosphotransferase|nr:phosphotransferase [Bacteroidales bacterium]